MFRSTPGAGPGFHSTPVHSLHHPLALTVKTAVRFCTASPVVMHWPAGMEVGAAVPCAGSGQPPDWLGGHSVQNSQAALDWH